MKALLLISFLLVGCVTDHEYCDQRANGNRDVYWRCRDQMNADARDLANTLSNSSARAGTISSGSERGLNNAIPEPKHKKREICETRMENGRTYQECIEQ